LNGSLTGYLNQLCRKAGIREGRRGEVTSYRRLKIVTGILSLSCALTVAAVAQTYEVKIIQLTEVDGKIPVEIVNARIETTPHRGGYLTKLGPAVSLSIRNNTSKPMNSVVISTKTSYVTTGGGSGSNTLFSSIDLALHPDIQDAEATTPIAPGGDMVFLPQPIQTYSWMSSITITLHIDYADFADGSSVGPNQHGTLWIVEARKGAAKYAKWLKEKHKDKSKEEIESLLMNPRPPAEIGFEGGEEHGAQMYMSSMRSAIRRGIDVTKYLK
jgi:hypothetical protein